MSIFHNWALGPAGGGMSWSSYWATLISATVEDAAPTHVVLTFPTAQTSLTDSDFTIAGFTVSSASWTGAVLTLVLSTAVEYGDSLTVTFVKTSETAAVTNNILVWYLKGGVTAANCVGAYQPMGAADLATSYVNLANPGTNNLIEVSAPAFDTVTGWTFTGDYMRTGLYPTNNWSVVILYSNWAGGFMMGVQSAGGWFCIEPAYNSGQEIRYGNGGRASFFRGTPYKDTGFLAIAGSEGYEETILSVTGITAWTQVGSEIYIGCYNEYGSPAGYGNCKIQAIAFYNVKLTHAQVGAICSALHDIRGTNIADNEILLNAGATDFDLSGVALVPYRRHLITSSDLFLWTRVGVIQTGASYSYPCVFCAANGYIYISLSGSGTGIYRSTDGGLNFTQVLSCNANCYVWSIDEDSSGNLYACEYSTVVTTGKMQIWKSDDDGATWSVVYTLDSGVGAVDHVHDIGVDPANDYIYAIVGDTTQNAIIRSMDGGANWDVIHSNTVTGKMLKMAFLGNYVYMTSDAVDPRKIWRFTDNGGATVTPEEVYSWTEAADGYSIRSYGSKIIVGTFNGGVSVDKYPLLLFDGSQWSVLMETTAANTAKGFPNISRRSKNGTFLIQYTENIEMLKITI